MGKVVGDRKLIKMVWTNLISNAIKFTRDSNQVIIKIGRKNADTFFISDNGVGFDPGYKDKLFGVFQRLHSESEFEGTGIGLANVKRIICRHGGEVFAEGEINKGAEFSFSLPGE
jgi:light-regulated signal transduction histidine kinase (bacteriophytochrome)